MSYTQLTYEQRYQIKALLKMGHNQTQIASAIGVHRSTISRELKRNSGQRGYRPKQAHRFCMARRSKARRRITPEDWAAIEDKIRMDWSPEQIAERTNFQISHEWIYQYIWANKRAGGELYKHLRCKKKYRRRSDGQDRRGKIRNRVSIDERPAIVEERSRIGDWEGDTMTGKGRKRYLVTLTERKSRFTLFKKVNSKSAAEVREAVIELLEPFQEKVKTITFDNGKEFAEHERIAQELEADIYFAHPYASYERGTNENTNGLIRQYFPKSSDLSEADPGKTSWAENRLNNRPRKCIGFQTPKEVFFKKSYVALRS
jgi:IS30 family transposase